MTKENIIKNALIPFATFYYELLVNGKASLYADNENYFGVE